MLSRNAFVRGGRLPLEGLCEAINFKASTFVFRKWHLLESAVPQTVKAFLFSHSEFGDVTHRAFPESSRDTSVGEDKRPFRSDVGAHLHRSDGVGESCPFDSSSKNMTPSSFLLFSFCAPLFCGREVADQ